MREKRMREPILAVSLSLICDLGNWFGLAPFCTTGVTSWFHYLGDSCSDMISGILPSLSRASAVFSRDRDNFELEL